MLFLVCHASEALLPTLRSRCRALLFQAVEEEKISAFLSTHGATEATAHRIASLACGSFYYAGLLAEAGGEDFVKAFGTALSARLTGSGENSNNVAAFADMLGGKSLRRKKNLKPFVSCGSVSSRVPCARTELCWSCCRERHARRSGERVLPFGKACGSGAFRIFSPVGLRAVETLPCLPTMRSRD